MILNKKYKQISNDERLLQKVNGGNYCTNVNSTHVTANAFEEKKLILTVFVALYTLATTEMVAN